MQRLEVRGAVRPIYGSLGVKRLITTFFVVQPVTYSTCFQPTLMTYQAYSCLHFITHPKLIFNSVMP